MLTRYAIPGPDRARIRELRTVFAERLSEEEHDQLAGIILRGRISPAQAEFVRALHDKLSRQREHGVFSEQAGGERPCRSMRG